MRRSHSGDHSLLPSLRAPSGRLEVDLGIFNCMTGLFYMCTNPLVPQACTLTSSCRGSRLPVLSEDFLHVARYSTQGRNARGKSLLC